MITFVPAADFHEKLHWNRELTFQPTILQNFQEGKMMIGFMKEAHEICRNHAINKNYRER